MPLRFQSEPTEGKMMSREYDLIRGTLRTAQSACEGGVVFGKMLTVRMPVEDLPNGYPAEVRIAVGPDEVICRVIHTGRDHQAFRKGADSLLDFVAQSMRGWRASRDVCGTGGGKVRWQQGLYRAPFRPSVNHNYRDLFDAVAEARLACVARRPFSKKVTARWQSAYMDDGVYPIEWHVKAEGAIVVVHLKNKGSDSEAFQKIVDWAFDRILKDNSDGRSKKAVRGLGYKIFSDTLRLEVPIG